MKHKGCVHLYYGDGKGKTTASFGLALRMAGNGGRVVIAQFLKGRNTGEIEALKHVAKVEIVRVQTTNKFIFQMNEAELADLRTTQGQLLADALAASGDCELLVLDEVLDAYQEQVIDRGVLVRFLESKPAELELVMTGHCLPPELASLADYITEFSAVRHPYERGVQARKGVEF